MVNLRVLQSVPVKHELQIQVPLVLLHGFPVLQEQLFIQSIPHVPAGHSDMSREGGRKGERARGSERGQEEVRESE